MKSIFKSIFWLILLCAPAFAGYSEHKEPIGYIIGIIAALTLYILYGGVDDSWDAKYTDKILQFFFTVPLWVGMIYCSFKILVHLFSYHGVFSTLFFFPAVMVYAWIIAKIFGDNRYLRI